MTKLRDGQRVRFTVEGTIQASYNPGDTSGDALRLKTEHGYFYTEVERSLEPFIEILADPLPTEDGWYEAEEFPLSVQGHFPYQLRGGKWRMNGSPVEPPLGTLHRLGRVG
jgi:hypothetical protein